jgi:uncharacterized protein (DUF4415 family)
MLERQVEKRKKFMKKKSKPNAKDELRPEYDFRSMQVIGRGPGRKVPENVTVQLDQDVAAAFPNSESVNEALRFLIRVTKKQSAHSS